MRAGRVRCGGAVPGRGRLGDNLAGKQFDALIVDAAVADGPIDTFPGDGPAELFQKFIYLGDDRNIVQIYVQGQRVK